MDFQAYIRGLERRVNALERRRRGGKTGPQAVTQTGELLIGQVLAGDFFIETVVFATPFSGVPSVMASSGSSRLSPAVFDVTEFQVTIRFDNFTSGNASLTTGYWTATLAG